MENKLRALLTTAHDQAKCLSAQPDNLLFKVRCGALATTLEHLLNHWCAAEISFGDMHEQTRGIVADFWRDVLSQCYPESTEYFGSCNFDELHGFARLQYLCVWAVWRGNEYCNVRKQLHVLCGALQDAAAEVLAPKNQLPVPQYHLPRVEPPSVGPPTDATPQTKLGKPRLTLYPGGRS